MLHLCAMYLLRFSVSVQVLVIFVTGVSDVSSINPDTTLGDLGLDSLMGVEVKQTLERDYDLNLPMKDIRQLTVNKLKDIAGNKLAS